jgi:hypothetical protein
MKIFTFKNIFRILENNRQIISLTSNKITNSFALKNVKVLLLK